MTTSASMLKDFLFYGGTPKDEIVILRSGPGGISAVSSEPEQGESIWKMVKMWNNVRGSLFDDIS